MTQNITLTLDNDLVGKLRAIATIRSKSMDELLQEELASIVEKNERFETAKRSALADLEQGFNLGAQPATRDGLHDREALR